jgi:tetratricopeptide (TPR) repeat protein/AraC-like DNA-binding protein
VIETSAMTEPLSMDQAFIRKLTDIVLANLQNENFGVNELAREAGISRFTINRRLKSVLNQDTGHFIRGIRLKRAMEMLQDNEGTVAEIAFRVGFSSPAYFNRCFHEHYGYPPGKAKLQSQENNEEQTLTKAANNENLKKIPRRSFKLTAVMIFAFLVLITAFFIVLKSFRGNTLKDLRSSDERISVAVMPFQNMTNDTIWNIWQDGIQNELIASLTNSEELKIRQTESINSLIQSKGLTNYVSITPSVARTISQKLEADIFVYGSIKQQGKTLRVNAQLIDSKTEEVFKSFQIDGTADKILYVTDSLSNQIKDFLIVSVLGKEAPRDFRQLASTYSPEAYRYYVYADKLFRKWDLASAERLLLQAIAADSNFVLAAVQLAVVNGHLGRIDQANKWCLYAYNQRDKMPLQQSIYTNYVHAVMLEARPGSIKYLKQLIEMDDQTAFAHCQLGIEYHLLHLYEEAIPEFKKAIELYHKWGSEPRWIGNYTLLGDSYHKTGQYKKEKKLYKNAEKDFPGVPPIVYRQAVLALSEGKIKDANNYIEKFKSVSKENSASETDILTSLAGIYSESGVLDKAEEYYRQAFSSETENLIRISNLAYFLIDKDRNIKEGMELIDKALELNSDNYSYLHIKGWGFYKQGNYEEALELLNKSWEQKPVYDHEIYLHLDEVKKAVINRTR